MVDSAFERPDVRLAKRGRPDDFLLSKKCATNSAKTAISKHLLNRFFNIEKRARKAVPPKGGSRSRDFNQVIQ